MASNAPDCFGYITTHDASSDHCKACGFERNCAQQAYDTGIEIQAMIDISEDLAPYTSRKDLTHKTKPTARRLPHYKGAARIKKAAAPIPDTTAKLIDSLPLKPRQVALQSFKKSIDVAGELRSGRNPYLNRKPAYMTVICELTLKGRFTRTDLVEALQKKFPEWTRQTAISHAYIALKAMSVYGLKFDERRSEYYLDLEKQ